MYPDAVIRGRVDDRANGRPNGIELRASCLVSERYDVALIQFAVISRHWDGTVEFVNPEPIQCYIGEITSVELDQSGGNQLTVNYGDQKFLSQWDWDRLVSADGDLSAVMENIKTNEPPKNIGIYRQQNPMWHP